ncbi:hypothetical protein Q8A67_010206 [Cirrhinus molitorella]|uniref:non-specific serine/threonine protein kinase n=1 Tax=Cirrhinus molitorella TaxID=172907 RepID=A0AA88TYP4_9TELE|nr:hypothetical protein Q8A67_010206 [Cirrhinus molitorella]
MTSSKLQSLPCLTVVMTSSKIQTLPYPVVVMTSFKLQSLPRLTVVKSSLQLAVTCLTVVLMLLKLQSVRQRTLCHLSQASCRMGQQLLVVIKFVSNRNAKFISTLSNNCLSCRMVVSSPRVQEIAQLLDWRVESDHYVLVLERPVPCEELNWFLLRKIVTLEEDVARVIMRQATFAAQTCCRRGVLHRDIKMENLLINPDTLEVKLIDFGCGDFLTDAGYTSFAGMYDPCTRENCPPENLLTGKYHGKPATVWSLGILLFALLCGDFPKTENLEKINSSTWAKDGLSKECCDFIHRCLKIDPKQRIELEKLSLRDWFTIADKENNNSTIMDINSCRYEISSQLGKGECGTVYAATHLEDGLQVVIKFVSSRNRKFICIAQESTALLSIR